jgi:hypothetical protein
MYILIADLSKKNGLSHTTTSGDTTGKEKKMQWHVVWRMLWPLHMFPLTDPSSRGKLICPVAHSGTKVSNISSLEEKSNV